MEIKVTQNGSVTLLEVLKGDKPVNAQNQVTRQELLPCLQELEVSGGELCFVSGMPMWAITGVALKVKNLYGAVAIYDPRIEGSGGCVVVHSTNPKYEVGQLLPLA